MVDVIGELWVKVPHRIIRQRGQMHDRIEPSEIGFGKVTKIFTDFADVGTRIAKITVGEEIRVQADHVVTSGTQDGPCYGTDVPLMASKQYFHATLVSVGVRALFAPCKSAIFTGLNLAWFDPYLPAEYGGNSRWRYLIIPDTKGAEQGLYVIDSTFVT
jgi:hypothetical protein